MGDAEIVFGALGFFIIVGLLLGLSGLTGVSIEIPSSPTAEVDESGDVQGWVATTVECLWTFYQDCSRSTVSRSFDAITDIVGFGLSALGFLFQLATFQLPEVPGVLNAIIVLPSAAALGFVGIKTIRGAGG